jgi:hypothetical protein
MPPLTTSYLQSRVGRFNLNASLELKSMKRLKQSYKMRHSGEANGYSLTGMCLGMHQEDEITLTLKVTDKEFEVINFSALRPHDSATTEHLNFKRTLDTAHGSTGK